MQTEKRLQNLCFVNCASSYNLVIKVNLLHNFSQYVYFFSLHVLGDYVPIIRRNNCICATLGICHCVWMTVWYAGWCIPPCIPGSHPYRVTSTKCRIDTVISPDDAHIVTRNMQRKEINILRKSVHQVGFIYKRNVCICCLFQC